jgi:hypothetical protein
VIQYESQFESKKAAIETVTPRLEKDGSWKVADTTSSDLRVAGEARPSPEPVHLLFAFTVANGETQ